MFANTRSIRYWEAVTYVYFNGIGPNPTRIARRHFVDSLFSALLPLNFAEFPGRAQVLGGGRQSTNCGGTRSQTTASAVVDQAVARQLRQRSFAAENISGIQGVARNLPFDLGGDNRESGLRSLFLHRAR